MDRSKSMTGDINLANSHKIINSANPSSDTDLVTKKYMETHVSQSHVTSSDRSNAFQYVMNNPSHLIEEDDIEFGNLVTFQSSPHSINKKAIDTKLIFDVNHGYYSSRLSINLYVLPNGSYTMAFELIWSTDDVDRDNVSLNGISAVETVHDLSNKTFDNYSRLILQFTKSTDTSPNHLYIDIVIKINAGKLYPQKLQTYLVCYGVKGLQSDIPSSVYDALWGVDNGVVTFNETINIGNNKITGVADGTEDNDVVNKSQLDILKKYYYTGNLTHSNNRTLHYPTFNKYPYQAGGGNVLIIYLGGYHHIIYTDYYKNGGDFKISDRSIGGDVLLETNLRSKSDWTPFTINTVIKVELSNSGLSEIQISSDTFSMLFDGNNNSTFFIEYLGP